MMTRYLAQAAGGQVAILRARRPIDEVVHDPATPPYLKRLLSEVSSVNERRMNACTAPYVPTEHFFSSYSAIRHLPGCGTCRGRAAGRAKADDFDGLQCRTGVPLLLNTSLNIMGKPIVHSLEDCLGLLFTTGIDALVVEDYLIEK